MTTNADFQSANQPTDATPDSETIEIDIDQATELMVQGASKIEAMEQYIEHLTAQLATAQAQAKAWEAWGEKLHHEFFWALDFFNKFIEERGMFIDDEQEYMEAKAALSTPKPQPVDASSLARIARVALDADKKTRKFREWAEINFRHTLCPDFEEWFSDKYFDTDEDQALDKSCQTLIPNDIALAKALVGGA